MNRHIIHMKQNGVNPYKIAQAANYVFDYLDKEKFNLKEIEYLFSSMGVVMSNMTKKDPLRKVNEFNYSSCIEELFSSIAASNTKS